MLLKCKVCEVELHEDYNHDVVKSWLGHIIGFCGDRAMVVNYLGEIKAIPIEAITVLETK